MGGGLQLCLIDGGDSLQLDLLPAASAREGMERRALRGGGGGGDTEIYCVISQRGGPLVVMRGRPEIGSEKNTPTHTHMAQLTHTSKHPP
jgi:hypothetical protein